VGKDSAPGIIGPYRSFLAFSLVAQMAVAERDCSASLLARANFRANAASTVVQRAIQAGFNHPQLKFKQVAKILF
jgi:hypothetical protein